MRSDRPGFTLIELLVVVAIIAVLVAILLPALSAAREAGKTTQCLSSLRQLGVRFAQYGMEYGEHIPGSVEHHTRGWQRSLEYAGLMMPGYGHTNDPLAIYGCPKHVSPLKTLPWWQACSYGDNAFVVSGCDGASWGVRKLRFSELSDPSSFFLLCDFYNPSNDAYEYVYPSSSHIHMTGRHGTGAAQTNMLFGDGHAWTTTPEEFEANASRWFLP
ncbi:MAG: prepilin-type N-terminal cleavage/methylation domain-containing protein [Phycisphaerae bacterium]|nr:prepilin-type N-terminal cleavage/methylation domain-containing protein [Phycisphaerae bacterium]